MDLNRLTRDADDLIRKVVSRYNQLYIPTGTFSQLELDLMLDDLRKLYDTFKNIGQINLTLQDTLNKPEVKVINPVPENPQPAATVDEATSESFANSPLPATLQTQPQPEPELNEEKSRELKPEFKSEPEPEIVLPHETQEESDTNSEIEPEPVYEIQSQATPEVLDLEKPDPENVENSNGVKPEPPPAMLADKFNPGNKSLSETMASSQVQGGIGSRLLFQPIADLITGIGLNDKFSFISDLFANNAILYDEAINRINKAVNLDEANWILHKYHNADWGQKQESLARLKDFVKRRFI